MFACIIHPATWCILIETVPHLLWAWICSYTPQQGDRADRRQIHWEKLEETLVGPWTEKLGGTQRNEEGLGEGIIAYYKVYMISL